MKAYFRHIEGSNKGRIQEFSQPSIRMGRNPENDIAFDPFKDIDASGKHAEVYWEAGHYYIRDLKSTNGTFVNGRPIKGPTRLSEGDSIECARNGPKLGFSLTGLGAKSSTPSPGEKQVGAKTVAMMIQDALAAAKQSGGGRFGSTTVFMKKVVSQAVAQSSKKLKVAVAALVILLVGSVSGLSFRMYLDRANADKKIAQMREEEKKQREELWRQKEAEDQKVASLTKTLKDMETKAGASQKEVSKIKGDLAVANARAQQMNQQLATADQRINNLQANGAQMAKARSSFEQIAEKYRDSIYMVCYVRPDGVKVPIGTAFAVSMDTLATNGHIANFQQEYLPGLKTRLEMVAIKNGNPAFVAKVQHIVLHPNYSSDHEGFKPDVALLRTNRSDLHPVELASPQTISNLKEAQQIAIIGFPGRTMDIHAPLATFKQGTIGRVVAPGTIQHDALTTHGNSGSPIFDTAGKVIGVLWGGEAETVEVLQIETDETGKRVKNPDGTPKVVSKPLEIQHATGNNYGVTINYLIELLQS